MSGLMWLLLGAALCALLAFFVLQRRTRTAETVGSPPRETAGVQGLGAEAPVVGGTPAARALLEEWRSATVLSTVESPTVLRPVVEKQLAVTQATTPCAGEPVPDTAPEVWHATVMTPAEAEQPHLLRRELERPFLTLEELEAGLSYGAMRVRIEEIRSRLKANASDARMAGTPAEDSPEGPVVSGAGDLDADVAARIDSVLTEQNSIPELAHQPRASKSEWVVGVRETGRDAAERHGNQSADEPPRERAQRRRRPRARAVRRRSTTTTSDTGAVLPSRRSTRRKSGS